MSAGGEILAFPTGMLVSASQKSPVSSITHKTREKRATGATAPARREMETTG